VPVIVTNEPFDTAKDAAVKEAESRSILVPIIARVSKLILVVIGTIKAHDPVVISVIADPRSA